MQFQADPWRSLHGASVVVADVVFDVAVELMFAKIAPVAFAEVALVVVVVVVA